MQAFWTKPKDVVGRIDAEYYRSEFVVAASRLQANCTTRPFSKLWRECNRIYIGIAGFQDVADKSEYIPYLRPVDITLEGQIQYDNLPWCERHWLNDNGKNGCAKPGDLIVEVKGNTRKTAVVDHRIPDNCIVSGSSYRIQLKSEYDPYFYEAFFTSDTGQLLKRRVTSNTTINYIDPDSFKHFSVPAVDPAIQRAIGNKVRKTERLRELANAGRARVDDWLTSNAALALLPSDAQRFLEHSPSSTIRDWRWVSNVDTADRLDPWPTHIAPTTVRRHLSKHGKVRPLCELARRVTASRKRREFSDLSVKGHYVSVLDLDFNGNIDWENASRSRYTGNGIELEPADLLYSCINPQQPRVGVVPGEMTGILVGSPEFAILRGTSDLLAYPNLLAAILRSRWVRVQSSFVTRSSSLSRRRLDERDLDGVLVPWSDDQTEELEKAALNAVIGDQAARAMIEDARSAVESLIDGTLDEAALLAEGEAIEQWLAENPSPHEMEKP